MSNGPVAAEDLKPAVRYRWPKATWLGLVAVACGAAMVLLAESQRVATVRVSQSGLVMPSLGSSPDYFVILVLDDGSRIETESYNDVPIGNGLNFELPDPVLLSDISQALLYDDDLISDDMIDHADVSGRKFDGQSYTFELIGPKSRMATAGMIVLAAGGVLLAYVMIHVIRNHVV